ncbi:M12 family metallopeptidase [Leptospira interrogans]
MFAIQSIARFLILLASLPVLTDAVFAQVDAAEQKRRAEATVLRKRIATADPSKQSFWREIKRLEAIGPPEVKIAVVQHPGGTVVYSYRNIGGLAVAESHIVLGPFGLVQAQQALLRGDVPPNPAFAVVTRERGDWWPDGIVPFEIDSGLETRARNAVRGVIGEFESFTPVRFRARNEEERYVRFAKQLPFLSSMTDHIGRGSGRNQVSLQTDDDAGNTKQRELIDRSVRHETGHALGMYHEHNRRDRDEFVQLDQDCIDFWYGISGNFSIEQNSKKIGPYDFESIMHYGSSRGEKGLPWERQPCFDMVKRPSQREEGDDTGEIPSTFVLSKHDVNALHHMYGRNGVRGEPGDEFGAVLLVHNFDTHPGSDNFPDLVVGAPGDSDGRGAVFLYKGTATGFVLWKVLRPSDNQPGQRFGQALAAGDFDGDGIQDLAVGAPRATVDGKAAAGKVYIFRIRGNRDTEQTEEITKGDPDNTIEVQDRFGQSLTAGRFFDGEENVARRSNLAIGAPGARNGQQGRVGRVWVLNTLTEPRLQQVRASGGLTKFGQFGFSLATLVDRPTPNIPPRDRLLVSAPGVTLGGCGSPVVLPTRLRTEGLETFSSVTAPNALPPSPLCPQDPNLSDAIDAFPNPVWDAAFGSRIVGGDFNGDGLTDWAATGSSGVHIYLAVPQGTFVHTKSVTNRDFGEAAVESSFGVALASGDLNGDGLDELLVGAPLVSVGPLQSVGRGYIYKGCRPVQLSPTGQPILPRPGSPSALDVLKRFCIGGLRPWFRANQTDFQSQSLRFPEIGGLRGQPMFPAFTDNRANDRFGTALAVIPSVDDGGVKLMIGTRNKSLGSNSGGAVFQFIKSLTSDLPPFRNHLSSSTLTSAFTTRISRD